MVQELSDCHLGFVIDLQSWLCSVGNSRKQGMKRRQKRVSDTHKSAGRLPVTVSVYFFMFSLTVFLHPFSRCRIKLYLLQVLHHRWKYSHVSEDNEEEWVTFGPVQLLSHLKPPTPLSPALPLAASLSSFSATHPFLCHLPSLFFCPCYAVSHHILAALFHAAHCLFCECLKFTPPTLCSSVSELQPNLSFHWQLHNVKITDWHALNEDRSALKPPSGCTSLTRNVFCDVDRRATKKGNVLSMRKQMVCVENQSLPSQSLGPGETAPFCCGSNVDMMWSENDP